MYGPLRSAALLDDSAGDKMHGRLRGQDGLGFIGYRV